MKKDLRLFLRTGALLGGGIGITIFFLMDLLFKDSLSGSWRDAIVNDLNLIFSMELTPDSPLVYITLVLVLLVVVSFGALIGAIFSGIYYRFFRMLNK
ncbi:MAG: hypothetical protein GXO99_01580 [Nitrospirae bacterium]|nr:hypothetical protein [Nitrospirota bacterium]